MRTVLITGVSGFVGGAVARYLLRKNIYDEVHGLARHDPHIPGLHFHHGDITDATTLPTGFTDADIVHAAGFAADGWDDNITRANQLGTANMLALSRDGAFVHVSSSSVYDLGQAAHMTPETAFNASAYAFYNSYAESKAQAELLVQGSDRMISPVILRPHAIYGPGDRTLLPRVASRIKRGRLMLPDAGRHFHSLTHIGNMVQAVALALPYRADTCEAYNITDLEALPITAAIELSLPQPPRIRGISTDKLLFLSGFLPNLSQYEIRQIGFERTYNIGKAQRDLGYAPTLFTVPLA